MAACIQRFVKDLGIPLERDRYGNLIVHLQGARNESGALPPIAFVAHMDHPGFEAVETREEKVIARALGGVPEACFSQGVPVQVVIPDGGRLQAETAGRYGSADEPMLSLRLKESRPLDLPRPVVLDLPDFQLDGELIHMRALDDLAGCACILAALSQSVSAQEATQGSAGDVYAVFTRAEEVGLVGARLVAEEGRLPQDTLVVSLEASRTLAGASVGEGPVVRVGDASFTFDAEAEGVLLRSWEQLVEHQPDFKAQRQLMSGGTCEASGFRYYGYRTTGIAFPLGNYHNSAPGGEIAPEYIHVDDYLAGVELVVQAVQAVGQRRESRPWRRMHQIPQDSRSRLAESADHI